MSDDPKQVGRIVIDPLVARVMRGAKLLGHGFPGVDATVEMEASRLSAVIAAARTAAAAAQSVERLADPYAPCPGHTNHPGVRDDGRRDDCAACQFNDRTDADIDTAERVLTGTETNLRNTLAAADGAM